ncbi:fumarylacetoacetate hydrolase family protein [Modestobacter sp. VKM Ac-2978]|uniref:fumarylacetoacetate hydrolase family protein n=1 Tax=Modestobacter sp. VKM Ac-2978 TaxID=3004132 RepID=UPI0022AA6977|nr:fumarylacetoacetate hydrolase family protein [Modestobacter sp. VKM Ac-2978]MCZ2849902.1 fumarylacetoacetate hydrolase family protein [Modestobacter sp. VKM Ac-2978]
MPTFHFGEQTLPYGVVAPRGGAPRVGVAVRDLVLDLAVLLGTEEFGRDTLAPFMAAGPRRWAEVRSAVAARVRKGVHAGQPDVHGVDEVAVLMPFEVADFVDFFSGIEHASNAGRILRPGEEPLKPNYRHLPVGYHGRAGTVIPSGADVVRPAGQQRRGDEVAEAPTRRLDVEVEMGYVVGCPSRQGEPVPADRFREHVFGAVLLVDWSARDIQAWEYQPLGPFLGKSFATTISSWVVPMAAFDDAWVSGPHQEPAVLAYLQVAEPRNPAVTFELEIDGHVLSRPSAGSLYWSPAQQLAHMTRNGASLRTGDLYGTGTISSFDPAGQGSLLELSWGGTREIPIGPGTTRTFLEDGDRVALRGWIGGDPALPMGEAVATIRPAP